MLLATALLQSAAVVIASLVAPAPEVIASVVAFLRIGALYLVPQALVFVCAAAFQGWGIRVLRSSPVFSP